MAQPDVDPIKQLIYQAAQEFPEAREKLGAPTDFQFVNITPESWQNWAENGVKLDETPQSTGGNPFEDDDYELTLEPKRKRKKDEAKIPRWPNAFICFRRVILAKGYVSVELAQDNRTLSKICGRIWQNVDPSVKAKFKQISDNLRQKHQEKFPDYKFAPKRKKKSPPPAADEPSSPIVASPSAASSASSSLRVVTKRDAAKQRTRRKPYECTPADQARADTLADLVLAGKKGDELTHAFRELEASSLPPAPAAVHLPMLSNPVPRPVLTMPVPDAVPDRRQSLSAPQSGNVTRRSSTTFAHRDSRTLVIGPLVSLSVRGLALEPAHEYAGSPQHEGQQRTSSFPGEGELQDGRATVRPPVPIVPQEALFGDFMRDPFATGYQSAPAIQRSTSQSFISDGQTSFGFDGQQTSRQVDNQVPPHLLPATAPQQHTASAFSRMYGQTYSYDVTPIATDLSAAFAEQLSFQPHEAQAQSMTMTFQSHDPQPSFVPQQAPLQLDTNIAQQAGMAMEWRTASPPPLISYMSPEYLTTVPGMMRLESGMYGAFQQQQTPVQGSAYEHLVAGNGTGYASGYSPSFGHGATSPVYDNDGTASVYPGSSFFPATPAPLSPTVTSALRTFASTPISPTFPDAVHQAAFATTPISPTFSTHTHTPAPAGFDQTAFDGGSPFDIPGTPISPGATTGSSSPYSFDANTFVQMQPQQAVQYQPQTCEPVNMASYKPIDVDRQLQFISDGNGGVHAYGHHTQQANTYSVSTSISAAGSSFDALDHAYSTATFGAPQIAASMDFNGGYAEMKSRGHDSAETVTPASLGYDAMFGDLQQQQQYTSEVTVAQH